MSVNIDLSHTFYRFSTNFSNIVKAKWKILLLTSTFGGIFGALYYNFLPKNYSASLRFVVKAESSGSGLLTSLGSLGAALSGNSVGSPLERTVELINSDQVALFTLFDTMTVSGKSDYVINQLLKFDASDNYFNKSDFKLISESEDFFGIDSVIFSKRRYLKYAISHLNGAAKKDGIIQTSYDKKSGIVGIKVNHFNESFAIELCKITFKNLRKFYIEQSISVPQKNVSILERKSDSIRNLLSSVQNQYAAAQDNSVSILFQSDKVGLRKMAIQEQFLLTLYAEIQKNLESFKFISESAAPTLTIVDIPFSPLKITDYNVLFFIILGFFGTLVLLIVFFLSISLLKIK